MTPTIGNFRLGYESNWNAFGLRGTRSGARGTRSWKRSSWNAFIVRSRLERRKERVPKAFFVRFFSEQYFS